MISKIRTYSDYINRYGPHKAETSLKSPGEHHFVATYLLPRLFKLRPVIPFYINPDGTKKAVGDIAYHEDGRHTFGIEIKMGVVRLTRGQYKSWIVSGIKKNHPDLFIGVGCTGMWLLPFHEFKSRYREIIKKRNGSISREVGKSGYGPLIRVDVLAGHLEPNFNFEISNGKGAVKEEIRLMGLLDQSLPQNLKSENPKI